MSNDTEKKEYQSTFTKRFIARIIIEAETPLAIGSGNKDITTDALVVRDVNGLPYIPGTTLSGIIRHAIDDIIPDSNGQNYSDNFFGFQEKQNGKGSEIIFTDAKIIGEEGKVIDGICNIDWNSDFYAHFKELPIRQHTKINERGVTEDGGKFDEEVVYKGTRFCFEIEMVSKTNDSNDFKNVLKQIYSQTFRIGSGTRCGFGKIKVISLCTKELDLTNEEDLKFYLEKSSLLSAEWKGEEFKDNHTSNWIKYELKLKPDDFFLFGSGFGDDEADMTPVKEAYISWENGKPKFTENAVLIPATSLKGALAHRTAFHYNMIKKDFADAIQTCEYKNFIGKKNNAVRILFGSEGEKNGNKQEGQARGNVIFSDIIENKVITDKIINHVAIDRFTGGAIDGALFTEKTSYGKGLEFTTEILVDKNAVLNLTDNEDDANNIIKAFENAINDICIGMLPLGGGVNRGNGTFTGICNKI